jgi:hypothetical protein
VEIVCHTLIVAVEVCLYDSLAAIVKKHQDPKTTGAMRMSWIGQSPTLRRRYLCVCREGSRGVAACGREPRVCQVRYTPAFLGYLTTTGRVPDNRYHARGQRPHEAS